MIAVSVRQHDRTQGRISDAKSGHVRKKVLGCTVGIEWKPEVEQDYLARGLELDAGATNLLRPAVDTSAKRTGCFGHPRLALRAGPNSAAIADQPMTTVPVDMATKRPDCDPIPDGSANEGEALCGKRGSIKAETAPGDD